MFGTSIIQNLKGDKNTYHKMIVAKINDDLKNKKGRITLIPGNFDGEHFTPSIKRGPGMVSVLSACDSFIVLDENVSILKKDTRVDVIQIKNKRFIEKNKDFLTYAK
jgi:molybdopterin molybdotransferase